MEQSPCLDSVLSFAAMVPEEEEGYREEEDGGDSFEFAFAQPLVAAEEQSALADDLFAHGRILPAYPVFDRRILAHEPSSSSASATAPPSPVTYCAWAPRSAPGSPARDAGAAFPKSASTGEPRQLRLRDVLVGSSGGRSHSDGKEKFVFPEPSPIPKPAPAGDKQAKKLPTTPSTAATQQHKQGQGGNGKKKGAVTEMDMATAHRLFYSKTPTGASGGERRQQTSYLPYRPAFVGFFAAAHAVGRSHHHPY